MSQNNVKLVLHVIQLWNEGDLEGWAPFFDHDVVVTAPEGWLEGAASEGFDAWKLQAQSLRNTWSDAKTEVDEIRAVGDDRVFTRMRYVTRGEDPGISFDTPMAAIFWVEGGKITRGRYFWDVADALEAAGLSG
jgi:ketosteroid isomerase-like protein